jgi:hypothetical protein
MMKIKIVTSLIVSSILSFVLIVHAAQTAKVNRIGHLSAG